MDRKRQYWEMAGASEEDRRPEDTCGVQERGQGDLVFIKKTRVAARTGEVVHEEIRTAHTSPPEDPYFVQQVITARPAMPSFFFNQQISVPSLALWIGGADGLNEIARARLPATSIDLPLQKQIMSTAVPYTEFSAKQIPPICRLSNEILIKILDEVPDYKIMHSICLGLTCKRLYEFHKSIWGDRKARLFALHVTRGAKTLGMTLKGWAGSAGLVYSRKCSGSFFVTREHYRVLLNEDIRRSCSRLTRYIPSSSLVEIEIVEDEL